MREFDIRMTVNIFQKSCMKMYRNPLYTDMNIPPGPIF